MWHKATGSNTHRDATFVVFLVLSGSFFRTQVLQTAEYVQACAMKG